MHNVLTTATGTAVVTAAGVWLYNPDGSLKGWQGEMGDYVPASDIANLPGHGHPRLGIIRSAKTIGAAASILADTEGMKGFSEIRNLATKLLSSSFEALEKETATASKAVKK